ncbi:MAG: heteropolysaccharide repeat-containing protein [Parcubacteria group bacterium Gr01-1014_31]|nr:MAG: heteropolysaccharide repeat-containing protein [Parcubacteria group bacterium Gr01-1014_31]
MSLTAKIARNTVVQLGGKAVGLMATVMTVAIMTRALGAAGYGAYTAAFAFLQVAFILVDLGLQMTTVTLISDARRDPATVFSNIMGLRLTTAVAMAGLAVGGAWLLNYAPDVRQSVMGLAALFVAADLIAVLTGVFQYRLAMARAAMAEIAGKLALLIGVAAAAGLGGGLREMVMATSAAAALHAVLLWVLARGLLPFRVRYDLAVWRDIARTTWPLALTIAFNLVYFKMDTVILSWSWPAADVGRYGAPYRILELCINLGYLFLGLVLPLLTQATAGSDRTRFGHLLQRSFDGIVAVTLPLVVGGALLATPLMVLVAGPEFSASGPLLSILLVATGIILLAAVFGYGIVALGKQRMMLPYYAGNAAVVLVAYLIFIPRYGTLAAAWLTVGSELVILGANLLVMYRVTGFVPRLMIAGKAMLAAAVMASVLMLLPSWPVALLVALGGSIYLLLLRLLGGIPADLIGSMLGREPSPPSVRAAPR